MPSDLVNGWWDGNKVVTERDDGLVPPPPPKKSISEFTNVVTCKKEIQNPVEDAESNETSASNIDNTKPPNGDGEST